MLLAQGIPLGPVSCVLQALHGFLNGLQVELKLLVMTYNFLKGLGLA